MIFGTSDNVKYKNSLSSPSRVPNITRDFRRLRRLKEITKGDRRFHEINIDYERFEDVSKKKSKIFQMIIEGVYRFDYIVENSSHCFEVVFDKDFLADKFSPTLF